MEFRILGPLEVIAASEPLRLGGPKEQVVLAALVVDADRVVSTDRLLDVLWGDEVPATGVKTLRSHLSRLRGRLKPGGRPIETAADGYLLNGEDGQIDARRFEELLAEARRLREAGTHQAALGVLEEALGLWRGRALHGFEDHEFARIEATRLEELRLEAIEARIDSELEMGRHESVVADLERLLEQHPLREGLWSSLMTALYRSGRQAEALRAFQRARSILGDELGIEPSPELKSLEEAILLQSDAVAAPRVAARFEFIPDARTSFIGREDDMAELLDLIGGHRCVTVTGTGGSGKTRLAVEAVNQVSDDYEDGVVLVELAPVSDPDLVPEHLAAALGDVGSHAADMTAALVEFMAPRHMLVVVDNCEHLARAAARLVDALLAGCPQLSILATSRERLGTGGEVVFRTPPLDLPDPDASPEEQDAAEAVRLYVDRVRAFDQGFAVDGDNRAAVVSICHTLDGIPLALELAAARTRAMAPTEIASRMEDRFAILADGLRTAPPRQQTLKATIDWSYDLCSEAAQEALRRLSVFAGGWSLDAAEAVVAGEDIDAAEVAGLLARLVDRSLVERSASGGRSRYRLLETIRQYAFDALVASGEAPAVSGRHCDWYLALAERAGPELKGRDQVEWWLRLDREHDNMRAAITWSLGTSDPSQAFRLVAALGWFWFMRGHWGEAWRWVQRCRDQRADTAPIMWARVVHAAGSIEIIRGKLAPMEELLAEALEICREAGDELDEAWVLHYQGHAAAFDPDRHEDGRVLMERALEIFERLGESWAEGWSWRYIGQVIPGEEGIDVERRALDRFFELDDRWCAAYSLFLLGNSYLVLGRYEEAEAAERQAMEVAAEVGDVIWKGHAMGRLGIAARLQGETERAWELLSGGLEIHRRIGDDNCVALLSGHLGLVLGALGRWEESVAAGAESVRVWHKLGSTPLMVAHLGRLAAALAGRGDVREAAVLYGATESPDAPGQFLDRWDFPAERARLVEDLRRALGDELEALLEEGRRLDVESAFQQAMESA